MKDYNINSQNLVDYIMRFEDGELDDDEVRALFQYLLDSGTLYSLQGIYQRIAQRMIDEGEINFLYPGKEHAP